MLVKIHEAYRNIVGICDSDLIGKKFEQGKMQIDLTGNFFRGEEKTNQEVIDIIEDQKREDATFYIVGEHSCMIALNLGLISKHGIVYIDKIPVGLVLL